MPYICCDVPYESEKEFKKHLRTKHWHWFNYADIIKVKMKSESLYNIIKNPNLLFGITNLITLVQDKAILYLPFSKDKTGVVLKRSVIGKLDGPKLEIDGIKYRFSSPNLIFDLEFRVKRINEEYSELSLLVSVTANIGLLGRLLPGEVIKSLPRMVTPQFIVEKIKKGLTGVSI